MTEKLEKSDTLFDRVVSILEQARSNAAKSINNQMVIAYWLIGREIVQEIQSGEKRADYGKKTIESLSEQLKGKYGRGFSTTNLRYFRTFYLTYSERLPEIRHIGSGDFDSGNKRRIDYEILEDLSSSVETSTAERGFSPNLGWSHYRALTDVANENERLFYEIEAEKEGWDVKFLERQIHTFLFRSFVEK